MFVQCYNCKKEMVRRPEGISKKTGKPYKAFYSCPNCQRTLTEEVANRQAEQGLAPKEIQSDEVSLTPKATGEKMIIDLLIDIQERVKGIEVAVGNNMVNLK